MSSPRPAVIEHEASASALAEYANVPIAFETRTVMRISVADDGGVVLHEEPTDTPIFKNYDSPAGEGPLSWGSRFDLSKWTMFGAWIDGVRVGSAAVVFQSPEIDLLEGRDDVGLLWDIRVDPSHRRSGVGSALLDAVEQRLLERAARWLDVETQDINAPASRFYARHGFRVRRVNPHAYPELPNEIQLLWRKAIRGHI